MDERKRITVFGCGALGSVFAGLLASAGHDVVAVCRWQEHREAIQERGLLLVEETRQVRVPVRTSRELPAAGATELVIVLVKAFDTEQAATQLAERVSPTTPVLTLQNGLGNAETLAARLRPGQVLAGATTFAGQRDVPGAVRLTGRGECEIGAWNRAAEPHLQPTARLLTQSGLPCKVSSNVAAVLWRKLAVNAVINPLTAILRVRNGELLQEEALQALFLTISEEVWRVAARYQIPLPTPPDLAAEARRVCELSAANRSSMCRDVEQGRRTEIEAINGAVVRLGFERGVLAPVNQALTILVEAMARQGSGREQTVC